MSNGHPCPRCGGTDRFYLVSNPRNGGAPFWLCHQCQHYLPATDDAPTRSPIQHLSADEIDQAHMGYGAVARWCAAYLWSPDPEAVRALNYLRARGFTDATIRAVQLGYHPVTHGYAKTGCGPIDWGVVSGITHEEYGAAQRGGLLGPQGRPKGVLRGTITLPYWHQGRCTLVRGRQFSGEGKTRYLSPAGVALYAGSAPTLYLSDDIQSASTILLCEGEFKALAARQAGVPAVAQPGVGYLPEPFVQALAGKTIVVAYDVEERRDPFELSPGERFTLTVVARLCGISQQEQIEKLYKALGDLEKAKSDDIREQTVVLAQVEAAKERIARLKLQLARVKELKIQVKVLRLPRRADEHKVDLDGFLLRHAASALGELVREAPDGGDWYTAYSGGEFAFTRTGMTNGKPVANYKARIVETVYQHDGLITSALQRLVIQTPSGKRRTVDISADEWADDRQAVKSIRKGLQEGTFDDTPMQALRAVRLLSNQGDAPVSRLVNTCTGWEQIDGHWHFLIPDGSIHAGGINTTNRAVIDADTVGNHYAMCGPGDAAIGAAAWLAFLRGAVCPQPLALVLAGQTALAVLHRFNGNEARSMVWLHNETGSLKTAVIRAGVLALFGPRFTAERGDGAPVIKWNSTATALSLASFYYRDLPLIIDDYKVGMINPEQLKKYIHDYSEGASRARGNVKLTLDRARPIRVMAFSTAEDVPVGDPGMQARLMALRLKPETVDEDALTTLQRAGVAGHLAAFWRGFIQFLAQALDMHGVQVVEERMQALIRADDAAMVGHKRTAGSLRQNRAAWLAVANWLQKSGYITKEEKADLNAAHLSARMLLTADQSDRQKESRPSQIFLSVLAELVANGEAIIERPGMTCSRCGADAPLRRATDGWFCTSPGCSYHIPSRRIVGFRCARGIGIFSQLAFQTVCRVRNDQRQPFHYSSTAIWQQLEADGALVMTSAKGQHVKQRNPAEKGPKGSDAPPRNILLIRANLLEPPNEEDSAEIASDHLDHLDHLRTLDRQEAVDECSDARILRLPQRIMLDHFAPMIQMIQTCSDQSEHLSAASASEETPNDPNDPLKKESLHESKIIHPAPYDTQGWITYTRALLRAHGTVKELSLAIDAMNLSQLQALCKTLEERGRA